MGSHQQEHDQQEAEWKEEAERLRILPQSVQRQVIDLQVAIANDPRVDAVDRQFARGRGPRPVPASRFNGMVLSLRARARTPAAPIR